MKKAGPRRPPGAAAPAGAACPSMAGLATGGLAQVAAYFQVLAEPTRLQLLDQLRQGERKVGDLARACGCSAANVSRHLAQLTQQGLVQREGRGTAVYYRIADASVFALCELACGRLAQRRG